MTCLRPHQRHSVQAFGKMGSSRGIHSTGNCQRTGAENSQWSWKRAIQPTKICSCEQLHFFSGDDSLLLRLNSGVTPWEARIFSLASFDPWQYSTPVHLHISNWASGERGLCSCVQFCRSYLICRLRCPDFLHVFILVHPNNHNFGILYDSLR